MFPNILIHGIRIDGDSETEPIFIKIGIIFYLTRFKQAYFDFDESLLSAQMQSFVIYSIP